MARVFSKSLTRWSAYQLIVGAWIIAAMAEPSRAAAGAQVDRCSSSRERVTSEHHYTLAARVRPLLFWISRDDVGDARIAQSEAREGTNRLELLIGSDPERAPMRINRWGYIAESSCGGVAELVGVMTESDEETIEEAEKRTGQPASEHRFKAIRSSVADGEVTTSLFRLALSERLTYRDAATLLARLPTQAATVKRAQLPTGTDTGFLVAMAGLLHETVHAYQRSGQVRYGLRRVFVHDGRLYDVTQQSARVHPEFRLRDRTYPRAIEGGFELRSRVPGKTTRFRIVYGTAPPAAEVPLQIVYRPRWWFETELQLNNSRQQP